MHQSKTYLLIFLLFNITILSHDHFVEIDQLQTFSYILRLKFPEHIKKIPFIKAYYKGKLLIFDQDFCILSESKMVSKFFLFITKAENAPLVKSNGNNIIYLERKKRKPYKFFSITLENKQWIVKEEDKDTSLKIPDTSIILLLNPAFIESINTQNFKHQGIIESAYLIFLPKIIINKKIKQEELIQDNELSILASCDLNTFHTPAKKHTKQEGNTLMSLRTS